MSMVTIENDDSAFVCYTMRYRVHWISGSTTKQNGCMFVRTVAVGECSRGREKERGRERERERARLCLEMETGVAMDIGTILTSLRLSTFELKTTMPFHVVGQENKQVHLLADAKRDVENNGSRSYQVCRRLPPPFCSTMADEKTDLSNNAQVVVCLRCVDNSLNLSDCNELIGPTLDAANVTFTIKNVPQRTDIQITGARGQWVRWLRHNVWCQERRTLRKVGWASRPLHTLLWTL